MFTGTALSVHLLVYAGLSLFIIGGPYLYMVVSVLYTYNLTLLLQQKRLRDENNGKDVLTDLDILNDSKNIIGTGKWYFIHTTSTMEALYRLGTVNSNTVNSKFHSIRSFFEIFATFLLFHV